MILILTAVGLFVGIIIFSVGALVLVDIRNTHPDAMDGIVLIVLGGVIIAASLSSGVW